MLNVTMTETGTINSFDFFQVHPRRTVQLSISVKPHPHSVQCMKQNKKKGKDE